MKKKYCELELEVVVLSLMDVLTISNGDDSNDVTGDDPYDFA